MGEHKAAVRLVGLRHAKKGSIIAEALEIIDPFALGPPSQPAVVAIIITNLPCDRRIGFLILQ
jgi:hypothetical protein